MHLPALVLLAAAGSVAAEMVAFGDPHPQRNVLERRQTCSITSDCKNTPPAGANVYCWKAQATCGWRCQSKYTQVGQTCVLTASLTSSSSSSSTTTTSRAAATTTPAAIAAGAKCSVTADCKNTPPSNANVYCWGQGSASGYCGFRCRSGYTQVGETCVHPSAVTTTTTTASPTPTCAAAYKGAASTVKGTGTLPKPTAFVKRSGTKLELGSKEYRIAGPNIYWLCSDENVNGGAPPDKARVREAMAIAVAMGANTIRAHTCGISVGPNNAYNLEPANGVWNDGLWDIRDYVLYAAREYGLRVILPLTDNYDYYHGGKYSFLQFAGASTANKGAQFYTNQAAINAYSAYIAKLLSRVNAYTGVSYANDPTILAWETGNELGGYMNAEMWPPAAWTTAIINSIKKYDKNHLVVDGTAGIWNYTTGATPEGLQVSTVDMVTDHGYPRKTDILTREISIAAAAKKAFFIGEYDWTSTHGGVSISSYLAAIERAGLGDMVWNVMGHDAQCCAFVPHSDGYSLYYPNGNTAADQANILAVVKHWYKVTGRAQPSKLPAVACPQPAF
ncbi:hypothetical protein JCM10207_005077 [Rhodosporidiobolus poonsookiae]